MFKKRSFISFLLVLGVIGLILPSVSAQKPGTLTGTVYWEDVKTPVVGAVVKLRSLQTGREYAGAPSDKDGIQTIIGIPEGRYILGVSTDRGDFNFNYEVGIKADESAKLSLALKTDETLAALEKNTGFFEKASGIALTGGGGGTAVLTSKDDKDDKKPPKPPKSPKKK